MGRTIPSFRITAEILEEKHGKVIQEGEIIEQDM